MTTVHYRGTRDELQRILAAIPALIADRGADGGGIQKAIQLRCGVALLSQIQHDFIAKSRGGIGRDGIKWDKLKRETIAQRRTTRAERKAAGLTAANRNRGLLTAAENKRWRGIFASRLAILRQKGIPDGEAKKIAASIAWATLKAEGAKTKLALFGNRIVDIGRDTGRMFRSLTPGVDDKPSGEAEQVFEMPPGAVVVGSNVPYFPRFHKQRPCWPRDGSIPDGWWPAILAAAQRGIVTIVNLMLQRGVVP